MSVIITLILKTNYKLLIRRLLTPYYMSDLIYKADIAYQI